MLQLADRAVARRESLLKSAATNCCRLIHGAADGFPGLVIEKLGPALIAQLHDGQLRLNPSAIQAVCERVLTTVRATCVYRKRYPRDRATSLASLEAQHRDPNPWLGAKCPDEIAVVENGLRFLVRPHDGYSTGFFLEQRDNRALIRTLSTGRRVLNLFAYTCAFGISAGAGEAHECVNVDVSKRHLEWGKRNIAENGLVLERQRFILSDVFDYLQRARRQQRMSDLIIIDPPSFGRDKQSGSVFAIRSDLPRLIDETLERLNRGGSMLVALNHRQTSLDDLTQFVAEAANRHHRAVNIRPLSLPSDFAGDPDYAKSLLAMFDDE
ncbi:MAG: class I SAM-dependent rRNA methyltransferase [Phycisphaerales bacterium]|nr:class I SAM-dependent rRNA methyltransferase [Phycisphaerales bacterium]